MGVTVKTGDVLDCVDARSGESQRGKWMFFKVKAKKGFDNLNLWVSNPDNVKNATAVKILSIDQVEMKSHLDEKSQKWYKDYNVTCTVERAESGRQGAGSGFMDASGFMDTEEDINKLFGL